MAFCNNKCGCGRACSRQDDHGGGCDCGEHNVPVSERVTLSEDAIQKEIVRTRKAAETAEASLTSAKLWEDLAVATLELSDEKDPVQYSWGLARAEIGMRKIRARPCWVALDIEGHALLWTGAHFEYDDGQGPFRPLLTGSKEQRVASAPWIKRLVGKL